jgi:hypothetical protein
MPTGFAGRETSHNSGPFNEKNREVEMASRIPPFVAIKRDPPGEKNYLSFFSEILYDTPSREKTCA